MVRVYDPIQAPGPKLPGTSSVGDLRAFIAPACSHKWMSQNWHFVLPVNQTYQTDWLSLSFLVPFKSKVHELEHCTCCGRKKKHMEIVAGAVGINVSSTIGSWFDPNMTDDGWWWYPTHQIISRPSMSKSPADQRGYFPLMVLKWFDVWEAGGGVWNMSC